jgi:hypothetical protein
MDRGEEQISLLRRYLAERGWTSRVGTYDRYGGYGMSVELIPPPTDEQSADLRDHFGDSFEFTVVRARFDRG